MASKRMFSMSIVDSDAFLDMPATSQLLYFHLGMRADDDGFVNSPKRIQRMVGASEDDLKLLIAKGFLIIFESGVVVIKHWRINNTIQSDRYKETTYKEELSMLKIKKNKAYTLSETENLQEISASETKCFQNVSKMFPQYRLDKISIDKISIEEESDEIPDFDLEEAWKKIRELYPKTRKNGMDMAKLRFLDLFKGISPNQYKDLAKMIARAVDLYKKDCIEQGDESFKYVPNMDKWLTESAGYWIEQAEEYERNRNVSTTQSNK